MKEILKTKEGKIVAGAALALGVILTAIVGIILWNGKEKAIQSDLEKFLAGSPDTTAQQLLGVYKTAINS